MKHGRKILILELSTYKQAMDIYSALTSESLASFRGYLCMGFGTRQKYRDQDRLAYLQACDSFLMFSISAHNASSLVCMCVCVCVTVHKNSCSLFDSNKTSHKRSAPT